MNRVVVLCGSRKPAPGLTKHSAARELLRAVYAGLNDSDCPCVGIDLRDLDIPQFDGRDCAEYESEDLSHVQKQLAEAAVLVVSVPAYWNAASGPLVNLLNVLGGAAYDHDPGSTLPLDGLIVVLVTVGADEASAYLGASQIRGIFSAMGAWVAPREVVVANPRTIRDMSGVVRQLRDLGCYAASVAKP
jgi:NAD(P)H-dependent FMN reductase